MVDLKRFWPTIFAGWFDAWVFDFLLHTSPPKIFEIFLGFLENSIFFVAPNYLFCCPKFVGCSFSTLQKRYILNHHHSCSSLLPFDQANPSFHLPFAYLSLSTCNSKLHASTPHCMLLPSNCSQTPFHQISPQRTCSSLSIPQCPIYPS